MLDCRTSLRVRRRQVTVAGIVQSMHRAHAPAPVGRWLAHGAVAAAFALATLAGQAAPQVRAGIETVDASATLQAALTAYGERRFDDARVAFEALSRNGSALADYNLAVMHLRDELPKASRVEAVRLLNRAAVRGFVTAQFDLGRLYEGRLLGAPDLVKAYAWYRRAAENGSVDAQVEVGTAHFLGRGARKDMAEAAHWYREAAKAGDIGAQYLIASLYESGDGVPRDLRLARYWYEVAASNGDVAAAVKHKALSALGD